MSHDSEHPYSHDPSQEPTRATPRISPDALHKNTQPIDQDPPTQSAPYGSPPPDYDQQYGQSYGQSYSQPGDASGEQPYVGGGYDPYSSGQYGSYQGQDAYGTPYGAPMQQPYGYAPAGGFAPPKPTNGLAIASLVCSLAGCLCGVGWPIGLVLGFLALPEAKRHDDGGAKGMAIAGITIGAIGTVLMVGWLVAVFAGFTTTP